MFMNEKEIKLSSEKKAAILSQPQYVNNDYL